MTLSTNFFLNKKFNFHVFCYRNNGWNICGFKWPQKILLIVHNRSLWPLLSWNEFYYFDNRAIMALPCYKKIKIIIIETHYQLDYHQSCQTNYTPSPLLWWKRAKTSKLGKTCTIHQVFHLGRTVLTKCCAPSD